MIDKQKICDSLVKIQNFSKEDIDKFDTVIDKEIKIVSENILDTKYENDERIVMLVCAKIGYCVALTKSSEDNVVGFTAGDISIKEDNSYLKNAKEMVNSAYRDCLGLLVDDGFAFLGV